MINNDNQQLTIRDKYRKLWRIYKRYAGVQFHEIGLSPSERLVYPESLQRAVFESVQHANDKAINMRLYWLLHPLNTETSKDQLIAKKKYIASLKPIDLTHSKLLSFIHFEDKFKAMNDLQTAIDNEYAKQQIELLHSYDALVRFNAGALSKLNSYTVSNKTIKRIANDITSDNQRDYISAYSVDDMPGWYSIDLEDRHSDLLTKSNADYIKSQFAPYIARKSQNVDIVSNGNLVELRFRVYADNALTETSYTPEFIAIAEIINDLENYPALDSDDLSRREVDSAEENIATELHSLVFNNVTESMVKSVWRWLWDNMQEELQSGDSSGEIYPSTESIIAACRALSIPLYEDED